MTVSRPAGRLIRRGGDGRRRRDPAAVVVAAVVALVLVVVSGPPAWADGVREQQWFLKPLRVAEAQRISKGAGVVVAVLDTGVDAKHPDLAGAVLPGRQVVQDRAADGDDDGHGTGIAGIIAGRGHGSGAGVLGIAPEAEIMPVTPANDTFFVAQGIRWAVAHGAKVINLAFAIRDGESLRAAVREAVAADVVLVGAAGNSGDAGNGAVFPAAYPEVLTVGAVDERDRVAKDSQHGPQVDLVAPGVALPAPSLRGRYVSATGTSASAAIVSGAVALIRAEYPDLSAAEVVARLTGTAVDRGAPGRDDYYGAGQLDLLAALQAAPSVTASVAPVAPVGPRVAAPEDDEGLPPLVLVGAGLLLLVAAAGAGVVLVARARRAGG